MVATFTAEEILEITTGRLAQGMMPDENEAAEICIDTREIKEGAWFVALRGDRFDGHDFLGDAFASGALGCIVSERGSYPIASSSFPLIAVDDTMIALKNLARNWRRRLSPTVVAVTGSKSQPFGIVTQLMARVMGSCFDEQFHFLPPTAVLPAGEALTCLLSMDEMARYCLFELTPRSVDELSLFCGALAPNILIVTNDGYRDLKAGAAGGDAIEALAEVLANMDPRKKMVISEDPPGTEMQKFAAVFPGRFEVYSETAENPLVGGDFSENRELAQHLWCVFTAAREMGVDEAEVLSLLSMENA
jgi:UDP-N-acetylmuramyl pentapeptide synthase